MAMKPVKKAAVKASASPKKSTATPKSTARGGPGTAGKNVSKTSRQVLSPDKQYNNHKKSVREARAQYAAIDKLYQSNPLGRLATGNLNKYNKDFAEVEKTLNKLKQDDKFFVKSGYKPQFAPPGKRRK